MPSDRPPPEPSDLGSDAPVRRRTTHAVRDGTLVFALVLAGFVAYALGAATTYRATAIVAVEPAPVASGLRLPDAADATDRLRRAALDPALVKSLAGEEKPVAPETPASVSARIGKDLSVTSSDGRRFTFTTTASTRERAQRLVNELAQQAARRAAQVLDPEPPPPPDPGAAAKAALFDFLTANPGVAAEPSAAPARTGPDPLISALKAERARIESKLAQPSAPSSENPYEDLASLEKPEFLRRRLKEIDNALEARTKPAPAPSATGPRVTPEQRAEWQRLLRAVTESKTTEPPPPRAPRVRVTLARAALPEMPIKPDRPRVVLLGVLFASLAGVLAALLRGTLEARAFRRYGIQTGAHPIAELPNTTLRIPRNQLPKPIAPRSEPPPTPVPEAPAQPVPNTSIPKAPLVPAAITPIPPAPVVPTPLTPIPPAPIVPAPVTPVPPVPGPTNESAAGATAAAPAGTNATASAAAGATAADAGNAAAAANTPAAVGTAPITPVPPAPIVVDGPTGGRDAESPPTTQDYADASAQKPVRAARRTTKIYGTPPPPDPIENSKALRTTQAYGSPPAANAPAPLVPFNPTPIPAEVLPPERGASLRPQPMIPLSRSSNPPAVVPSNRSGAPLAETGYSYVHTPVPEAHSIPQTPYPRSPSPPPRTEPYGSLPPVAPRRPPSDPPAPNAGRVKTPLPPEPDFNKREAVIRSHPVLSNWQPDPSITPAHRRDIAGEILTLAVDRCHVIGVTGLRGLGNDKSRAAVEIAFALAEARHPRILLVEGDFHFPQVQNWLRLEVPLSAGFSQQLRARIQGGKGGRWHVVECTGALHVLAEGVMRSPGLLLSNQFEQAMRELRSYYDIVVIDAPLAPNEADGQALADVVDGVVVVAKQNRATEIAEVSRIFKGKKLLRVLEI